MTFTHISFLHENLKLERIPLNLNYKKQERCFQNINLLKCTPISCLIYHLKFYSRNKCDTCTINEIR